MIGYNYRMSNVLAGIGRGQLQVLEDRVQARRRNFDFYRQTLGDLPGIGFMPEAPWGRHTRWLTVITVDPHAFGADREAIRLALDAENIEARPVWKPMHLQPAKAGCEAVGGAMAEEFFANGLCLPSGSNLSQDELQARRRRDPPRAAGLTRLPPPAPYASLVPLPASRHPRLASP